MIKDAIERAFNRAKSKKWDKIYIGVDLHGVVIEPDYDYNSGANVKYYDRAVEVLKLLSNRDDITLIMYTCSHPEEITRYNESFKAKGIQFDYVNENPEVENTRYGNYRDKPYFDILFEDKAGFVPSDWHLLESYFRHIYPSNYLVLSDDLIKDVSLINISILKDGGSISLQTNNGEYIIDNGINSINKGKLIYKATPNSMEVVDDAGVISDLIDLVIDFSYDDPIEGEYAQLIISKLKKLL